MQHVTAALTIFICISFDTLNLQYPVTTPERRKELSEIRKQLTEEEHLSGERPDRDG